MLHTYVEVVRVEKSEAEEHKDDFHREAASVNKVTIEQVGVRL